MDYVVDYSLASALFLAVIIWFYFKQKRIPNLRSRIYKLMLYVCAVSVVMDMFDRKQSFSIFLVSIKHFKTVNQQFGTKTGDEILKLIYSDLTLEYKDRSVYKNC